MTGEIGPFAIQLFLSSRKLASSFEQAVAVFLIRNRRTADAHHGIFFRQKIIEIQIIDSRNQLAPGKVAASAEDEYDGRVEMFGIGHEFVDSFICLFVDLLGLRFRVLGLMMVWKNIKYCLIKQDSN
jgi:hypothetical protein